MKRIKQLIAAALICTMALGFTACGSNNTANNKNNNNTNASADAGTTEGKYKDGTYVGEAEGNGGPIKIEVVVEGGDIKEVKVLDHHETAGLGDLALKQVVNAINENKSVNVDIVTGATMACEGALNATKDALTQAGGTEDLFAKDTKISFVKKEDEVEQSYDVVIIGAGGAGLSAAVEASDAGANVVVLEKMPVVGGNTLVSGGGLNVPGSNSQKENNVEDSVDQFFQDTMKGGDNLANEELVRIMAENALDAATWLEDEVNVEFMDGRLQQFGGHSVPRALIAKDNHGTDLIEKLKLSADENGVTFKMETTAEELIVDENGKVVGVKATNSSGQELTFNASNGVIIASGGFGANVEMRKKYDPKLDEKYMTTDQPGTTGDGITMAEKVGAELTGMEHIQTYPTCNPNTGIISYVGNSRFDGAILLNQEGARFVEEMERRDVISEGIQAQTGGYGYLVWGQEVETVGNMTKVHEDEFNKMIADGLLHQADTIEELAEFFKIDVATFKASVDKYNEYVANGKDEEFNRRGTLRPIAEGPFYIQKVVPAVHHTMGGLVINENAEVVGANGEVIDGLFAAGEVTGGIHGTNRLGGNAVTDIIVFGRIAGQNVVK